jgi:hypothetical protein
MMKTTCHSNLIKASLTTISIYILLLLLELQNQRFRVAKWQSGKWTLVFGVFHARPPT